MLMGLVDIDMLRSGPVLTEKDTGDVSKFLNFFIPQESLVLMGLVDIDMLRSGPVLTEKDTGDVSKFLNFFISPGESSVDGSGRY